jgi:hypothetical protein
MRRHAQWLLLFLALLPGFFSSSCGEGCSGDGDPDCSALTRASAVTTPPAPADALTLSCASPNAGSGAELEWELTVGGGGAPYAYTIDFGDGTAAAAGTWPATGVQRGVHGYGRPGDFRFTAQVRDAGGRTQSCGMAVTAPVSGLELICAATPRTGDAPLRVTFDVPPGGRRGCVGPCTVSWSFGDGSGSESGRAVHEYAPAGTGSTTYEAVATLQDGHDRQVQCRVPIEVHRPETAPTPNHPPVIDAFTASPASIAAGQSAALSGSVTDPDPGDTTTWSLSSSAGTLSPSSGIGPIVSTLTVPAGVTGNVTILATAADNHGATAQRSVTVSVTAPNRPPVITSLVAIPPLILGPNGGSSSIHGSIVDPDGDPITWTFELVGGGGTLAPTSGSGTSAAALLVIPASPFGGTRVIRLTARDPGGLTDTRTVTVTVLVDVALERPTTRFDTGGERVP